MLYTSVDKVKQHLISVFPVREVVFDQPVILTDTDFVTFFGGSIDESSLAVKSFQQNNLKRISVSLGISSTSLPDELLMRDSVVVASDSSLGTIYTENVDYIVDYARGVITIKTGGALSSGQAVVIWYGLYVKYSASSDYVLNAADGSLRRIASGDIASGETVLLDYAPIIQSYNDVVIQNAVDEANAIIEKTVDPGRQFGVEPVLQTAATYRAVEIVCRASAARELSSRSGQYNVALAWLKLAEEYAAGADDLVQSFRPAFQGPAAPTNS